MDSIHSIDKCFINYSNNINKYIFEVNLDKYVKSWLYRGIK